MKIPLAVLFHQFGGQNRKGPDGASTTTPPGATDLRDIVIRRRSCRAVGPTGNYALARGTIIQFGDIAYTRMKSVGAAVQHFPLRQDLVRKMRWALIPSFVFLVLFTLVVIFAYDFEGAAQGPKGGLQILYASIFGVFATVAMLAGNIWRKIPRRFDGKGLVIGHDDITIDFGHGEKRIDLSGVTAIMAVAARPHQTPEAVVFCKAPEGDLNERDRNRVIHKTTKHIARIHRFRRQEVLPLALFGEDRSLEIIAALRAFLDERASSKD